MEELEVLSGEIPWRSDFGKLTVHPDDRGWLSELYRDQWPELPPLRQWNIAVNGANVLRGMHIHPLHADFIIVFEGEMLLALRDLRPDSPHYGKGGIVSLTGERLCWVLIRPGILHGFYIREKNKMVWGLSHPWDMSDEIGCRWDDPEIGLDWPDITDPLLSERDRNAGSFRALVAAYEARLR
ncbi:hypothetical protein E5163_09615 [Marinicauda algicola]|uniref:dTDP-4-dehydrorhamnose 3,5-epimerase n=1 Tax=Marinicauda algicola TaxID=2029849 RepID=A0A4S2GXY8_9PROT|nr:dTDP-4-dehydrorhamnose 3,5-epimerase family protein [Marinicauda algicola]TGY88090.1 hypothetical protein E5163_09615 [Marinicauda algicola]